MTETLLLIRRCFLWVSARYRNISRKSWIISDMRSLSAPILSGSILRPRYISKIIMILCWCRSSCSIAVLPLHSDTLTWIREKQMKMDETVDIIRKRFGFYSVQRGLMYRDRILSACDAKSDHMVHPHGYFG